MTVSYLQERIIHTVPQYAQDPNDRHAEQMYHGSTFNQYALCLDFEIVTKNPVKCLIDMERC
jgi:hypothetical protein